MMIQRHTIWNVAVGLSLLAGGLLPQARAEVLDEPGTPPEELRRLVEGALPTEVFTEDNQALVAKLLAPRLGDPLSKTFNRDKAILLLFGRGGAALSPDCSKLTTPVGDLDRGDCRATKGDPAGTGGYQELRFSKRLSIGNISYLARPVVAPVDPAKLQPVQMTDEEAYKKAKEFLNTTFGLTTVEMPTPPAGAMLPVKSVALGWRDGDPRKGGEVAVEKVVMLQRGLFVDAGKQLQWIPGPGRALVVLDDKGIKEAAIRNWQQVMPHPAADPKNAKKRSTLVDEIVDDLMTSSQGPVKSINARIMLTTVPSDQGVGLLLPAVRMWMAPVSRELSEADQAKTISTAGLVREYPLVVLNEQRDE